MSALGLGALFGVAGLVGLGAGGKLDTAATGYGKVVAIETAGRYTYYVIKIA